MIEREEIAAAGPHFVGQWRIQDSTIATALIEYFESREQDTRAGAMSGGTVDTTKKHSRDLHVYPRDARDVPALAKYMQALNACYQDYLQQWPFLETMMAKVHVGPFNIQMYTPGGHFSEVHSERTSLSALQRVLVWMTYLNDVEADGETEFVHYGLKVQPRQGRTLIWPAEWTHAHRGLPVGAGHKYIVTGWMHFPDNDNSDDDSHVEGNDEDGA